MIQSLRLLHLKLGDGHATTTPTNVTVHCLLLTVIWIGVANIGLIAMMFKQSTKAYYVHSICMWIVAIGGFVGPFLLILPEGFHIISTEAAQWKIHKICGLIMLCIVGIQCILGMLARFYQQSSTSSATSVKVTKWIHRILGIILLIPPKISALTGWYGYNNGAFIAICCVEGGLILIKVIFFILRPNIQSKGHNVSKDEILSNEIKVIRKKQDLYYIAGDYFVFSDFVYDMKPLFGNHPGGSYIVHKVRERQVDRFLYGMEPLETQGQAPRNSHTKWALNIVGNPIARFQRDSYFGGMDLTNQCRVVEVRKLWEKSKVNLVELSPKVGRWEYEGIQKISQLGQYHCLTINDKKSRLYTVVNCMQKTNRALMNSITPEMQDQSVPISTRRENLQTSSMQINPTQMSENKVSAEESICLLIKNYDDGWLTSDFFSGKFNGTVSISKSKGEGMSLDKKLPGHIIIIAGGTGIYPFIDLIDLLCKNMLLKQKPELKQKILKYSPAAADPILQTFSFTWLLGFESLYDLHPITQFQCKKLQQSNPKRFKFIFSIKETGGIKKEGMNLTKDRFELVLEKQLKNNDKLSHIYMCGPNRMTGPILRQFEKRNMAKASYTVI